jgi:hypothetical protein
MKHCVTLILAVAILPYCSATAIHADIGPPPPPSPEAIVVFENLADFPDYDFYLKYPIALLGVQRGKAVNFKLPRSNDVVGVPLLAVPKGTRPVAVDGTSPGAIESNPLGAGADGGSLTDRLNGATIRYRIEISGDRLVVIWISTEAARGFRAADHGWIVGLGLGGGTAGAVLLWRLVRRGRHAPRRSAGLFHRN